MTNYEFFYGGTPGSLDPEYGEIFTGYRVPAGAIGATTSIQTANQLKEVNNLLNQGIKNIEVSTINPEVFEMIPDQHLKEINRLTKLTGTETSLHAPMIEPSGFTQQGWSEINREAAERQFTEIVKRSQQLSPKGNIPVTIHASAVPGTEFIPLKDEATGEIKEVPQRLVAVNQETGEMTSLVREKIYGPPEPEGVIHEAEDRLKMANDTDWVKKITNLAFYKKEADEVLGGSQAGLQPFFDKLEKGEKLSQEEINYFQPALERLQRAGLFLDNVQMSFRGLYEEAAKFGDEKAKQVLRDISEDWNKFAKSSKEKDPYSRIVVQSELLDKSLNKIRSIGGSYKDEKGGVFEIPAPQLYKPVEEFTKEKASTTLGNVAFESYKKFGDKAPIISIENPPYGTALGRAEDLKNLIEETRKKFVEKARKEGMSASQAENAAEKLIGATWDTSHISMMRKQGFEKEKLIEEARKIAPFVKHIHLNDNFGSTHTDLPPGMASVPFKEILKEFEKAGVKAKKVFEGGAFFQHFQRSPHPYVLEALGSPLYGMQMAPYWNQIIATEGNYFAGYGRIWPDHHSATYGIGFTGMPLELGGQAQEKQSRFAGAPNQ